VLAALAGRFQALRGGERIGYARAGDHGRERLGLSARELADLARVDTALRTLPRLEAALVSGELPWTKVRLVARAARPDEGERWIAFARRVSVRRLHDDVDRALLLADGDAGLFAQTGGVPDLEAELAAASDAEAERVRLQTGANTRDMEATSTGTGSDDADAARLQTGANPREVEGTPQEAEPETSRAFFTAPRDVAHLLLSAGPVRVSGSGARQASGAIP
jgi:hypothetical protein